jgi:hypothetical protein
VALKVFKAPKEFRDSQARQVRQEPKVFTE